MCTDVERGSVDEGRRGALVRSSSLARTERCQCVSVKALCRCGAALSRATAAAAAATHEAHMHTGIYCLVASFSQLLGRVRTFIVLYHILDGRLFVSVNFDRGQLPGDGVFVG